MHDCENITATEFYLTAFSTTRINEILIFIGFLFMYLLAVVGNLIIIVLVRSAPQLHTPMYFFLCNLSSVDVIYVSAILPKMLSIIITEKKTISFIGCMTQLFFFILCAVSDNYILACMAYDRYMAICSPLHYSMIMTRKVCLIIATSYMTFCAMNSLMINHFFCETMPLMTLSSSDTATMKILSLVEDICVTQLKVFSSCSSHIITVFIFYGPGIFIYMKPQSENSQDQDKILSMLYVAVVPMLNPFVYCLRNKEVLGAAQKTSKGFNRVEQAR
ncbi:hypothetical protein GDO78_020230 [Eleutherodactylus coqui]|uniref:Olfactory receptor n=1 Tax=Eleutherodactylus coqui TaxID=57060 RepID=A0A8J6EI50_ELECQ|nr:hypothetical protein GDO78_020230 [Eleutherodactylus coqui]